MRKLTAKEAAELLDVTVTTIRSYVKRDLLPAEKKGVARIYYYDVDDLRAFAKKWNYDLDEKRLAEILKDE